MTILRTLACAVFAATLIASVAAAAVPAPEPEPPPLRLPVPVSRTLPNGLRVVVFSVPRLPIVQMQVLAPAGAAMENDSLPGLAALTASLLSQGTTSRDAAQFGRDLTNVGATFGSTTTRDYALVACGARSSAFEAALELMSDAIINPLFGDEDFERARRSVAQQLSQQRQDLPSLVDDRTWDAAFAPHPYAHAPLGDIDALLATTRDRVRAFHRDRWRPDGSVLAIAGDVPPERAFAAAQEWFGRWSGHVAPLAPRPAPKPARGVRVVDLPGAPGAEVRVAVPTPGGGSPDRFAWQLAAEALQAGRLPAQARVSLFTQHDSGLLVIRASVDADSAAATLARIRGALRAFSRTPPAGAELEAARRRVAQSLPLSLETLGSLLSQWQAANNEGLSDDELSLAYRRLSSPRDAGDCAAPARAFAAEPVVVIAGPAASLKRALGTVDVVPLMTRRATTAADTLSAPTAEQLRLGRAAIASAVLAHGGATKLAAVHALVFEGEMTMFAVGQALQGEYSLVRIDPSRLSFATRILKFESRQVLDGDRAWSLTQADTVSLVEADSNTVETLRGTLRSDLVHVLRAASLPGSGAARRGTGKIGVRACWFVDFTDASGRWQRLAIDAVTHRVLAIDAALGRDLEWHERCLLSVFQPVQGVLLPMTEERWLDGEKVSVFRARTAAINQGVPEGLFRRPNVQHGRLLPSN